jgi:hypothetical protein
MLYALRVANPWPGRGWPPAGFGRPQDEFRLFVHKFLMERVILKVRNVPFSLQSVSVFGPSNWVLHLSLLVCLHRDIDTILTYQYGLSRYRRSAVIGVAMIRQTLNG